MARIPFLPSLRYCLNGEDLANYAAVRLDCVHVLKFFQNETESGIETKMF